MFAQKLWSCFFQGLFASLVSSRMRSVLSSTVRSFRFLGLPRLLSVQELDHQGNLFILQNAWRSFSSSSSLGHGQLESVFLCC